MVVQLSTNCGCGGGEVPPTPLGLNYVAATLTSITVDWLPDGSSQYKVYYKPIFGTTWLDAFSNTNTATLENLLPETDYEIQLAAIELGIESELSPVIVGTTLPDLEVFKYPTFINCAGATSSIAVAFEDNTVIYKNDFTATGTPLATLNKGDTFAFSSAQFDSITFPTGNCYIAGRVGDTVCWVPAFLANNTGFAFSTYRNNPQRVAIWAVQDSTVTLTDGSDNSEIIPPGGTAGNPIAINIPANSGAIIQWSMPSNTGLRYYDLTTDGYILAYLYSNGWVDPWLLMPLSKQIIVTPSNLGRVYTTDVMVDVDAQRSNGSATTLLVTIGTSANIGSTGSQMIGDSWTYTVAPTSATATISGNQLADANGGCSSPAIPTSLLYSKAATTEPCSYIKFMSTEAAVINIFNDDGSQFLPSPQITLEGTGICYELHITNIPNPVYFEAVSGKFVVIMQPSNTGDETVVMVYDL